MKTEAAQSSANETPWQRLDSAFRKVLTVSKEDLLKREAEEKQKPRAKKQRKKKSV